MPTILDSNVLLDLIKRDAAWFAWSSKSLAQQIGGGVCINAIVYSECAAGYPSGEGFQRFLKSVGVTYEDIPQEGAYLAGRAHKSYRTRGGLKVRTLPDFLIGAHAAVRGLTLLTRDPAVYRTYFPALNIIAPDTHP